MDMATRVQFLDEALYILGSINTLLKGKNPTIRSAAMGIL